MSFPEWQSWILPAALGFCVLIAMRHWRGLRERIGHDRRDEFDADEAAEPVELNRWRVEIQETAREIKAEIDSKVAVLRVLIRDAEVERLRLSKAIEVNERKSPALPAGEARELIHRLADEGRSSAVIAAKARVPLGDVEMLLNLRPQPVRSADLG